MTSKATLLERARKVLLQQQQASIPFSVLILAAGEEPPATIPEHCFMVQLSAYSAASKRADGTSHIKPV